MPYMVTVKLFTSEEIEMIPVSSDNIDYLLTTVKRLTDRYVVIKIINMSEVAKPSADNKPWLTPREFVKQQ